MMKVTGWISGGFILLVLGIATVVAVIVVIPIGVFVHMVRFINGTPQKGGKLLC